MEVIKIYPISTDISAGNVNILKLENEIKASGFINNYGSLTTEEDNLIIIGEGLINETGLNIIINNHVAVDLTEYKLNKKSLIDQKTRELIEAGFNYNGFIFSMSDVSQINYLGLESKKNDLIYPRPVISKNDQIISIPTKTEMSVFTNMSFNFKDSVLMSGGSLKYQIDIALTMEAVDAIVDNR